MNLRKVAVAAGLVLIGAGAWAASPAGASTAWTVQTTPVAGRSDALSGVSCLSGGGCEAVGEDLPSGSGSADVPMAVQGTGGKWAAQTVPEPANADSDGLTGVSCVASSCEAVGWNTTKKQDEFPLAEKWNGTKWTVQSTPNPPGDDSSLSAVSCMSASACMAVGSYSNSQEVSKGFTELWNGTNWTLVPFTDKFYDVYLTGVSCPSASFCLAVGQRNDGNLSATWNGTAWTVTSVANPQHAEFPAFNAVSCSSSTACTAVGSAQTSEAFTGLAERWNGGKWTAQSVPDVDLESVSCAKAGTCVAVGHPNGNTVRPRPVALGWSSAGGWASQATASPPKAKSSEFYGVSCLATGGCTATGWYQVTVVSGIGGKPLAEQN